MKLNKPLFWTKSYYGVSHFCNNDNLGHTFQGTITINENFVEYFIYSWSAREMLERGIYHKFEYGENYLERCKDQVEDRIRMYTHA